MKRPLLLAAVLAAAPLMAGTAKAQGLEMFNIVTPSAGVVNFTGTGTAQFNNSLGTTNNVNLGSNTNVGVSASASSTSDYTSSGYAQLDLDGSSRLQQTTGTATQAFNTVAAAESASIAASTAAFEAANSSKYGVEYTSSYDVEYAREAGWEVNTNYDADLDIDGDDTAKYTRTTSAGVEYSSESSFSAESQRSWEAGWENTYNQAYTNSYSTAVSTASSAAGEASGDGTIIANFKTTETGNASSASGALNYSFDRGASASADMEWGASYDSTDGRYSSSAEYERNWEASYQQSYSAAYSAANASGARESISEVEVQGIGSIADINSQDSSTFQASSDLLAGVDRTDSVGNGNASAAASLGTTSFAAATNATTASAFMQAFSGGGLGKTEITNITGDESIGYDVTTETVTIQENTSSYSVDADGNIL